MSIITIRPTRTQHQVYEALKNKDEIYYGGAAGGGKSWIICESRLINCYLYPGYRSFIGREELKRLMQSTFITWTKVCKHHNIPDNDWKLNGQYNYIEFFNGSRIDLLDLKYLPSDPLYERLGSLEYADGAIDEAGEVHVLAYEVLKSRIGRHMADRVRATLLMGGNPSKNWTYRLFYKPWKDKTLEDGKSFIVSKYQDNPYTAEAYGRQLDKIYDLSMKARLKNGDWEFENDPNIMIEANAINDLLTNTITANNNKYLVVDAARFGRDNTVFSFWRGLEWYRVEYRNKQGTDTTADDIRSFAVEEKIPYSHILVDEDGIGGGVVDQLKGIRGFIANRAPLINMDAGQIESLVSNYKNLKAQCAYLMAEKINNHECKVSFKDQQAIELLIADLEQYRVKPDNDAQKKQIIGKDEMKERLGRSPDFGDCFLMRMWFELKKIIDDNKQEYKQPAYEPSSRFEGGGGNNEDYDPFNMFK